METSSIQSTQPIKDRRATLALSLCIVFIVFISGSVIGLSWDNYASGRNSTPSPHEHEPPFPMPSHLIGVELMKQTTEQARAKSIGCVQCHQHVGDPHCKDTVRLGCTDCHGGDPLATDKHKAHVRPRFPSAWRTSANPERSYTLLNHESPDFIRFVNPGDFRVAHISCGTIGCHPKEVATNRKQIMTTGCMLWGSALYNNGSVPFKRARFGESYSMRGVPLRVYTVPPPTKEEMFRKGVVPFLEPLPRFEISQPGNVLRFFEQGGRFRLDPANPQIFEEPGRPRTRLSDRGLGTLNRTDPVFVSLNKTRLLDPTLNFLGTNDHPGDYRSSGCTACHVVYANDSSPVHASHFSKFGNSGLSYNPDPTIPKNEPGHPIEHKFRKGIPSSQCIVCHIHPGTSVMNTFLGYMWWDEETEGRFMYPRKQKYPTAEEWVRTQLRNPDEAALQGKWSNREFLSNVSKLNPHLKKTQFGAFHGHGWVFRAVYKKDKQGRLLDHFGNVVPNPTSAQLDWALKYPLQARQLHQKKYDDVRVAVQDQRSLDRCRAGNPVHMLDIHLEKGMHCVDCHFEQDVHGSGRLHMEVRAATEIACIDCHGTPRKRATLRTSGPASYTSTTDPKLPGRNLKAMRTPFGKRRFEVRGDRVFQNSMVDPKLTWEVVQVKDTIDPKHPRYNKKSHLAKTVRFEKGNMIWGDLPDKDDGCAHSNGNMSCIACHSSWNASCFGCHLPQRANVKSPHLHWDGRVTRNHVSYNFQTLRDDVYMLARDGDVTGNKIGPARSSCAIHVGSYNQNRDSIYAQQPTISAEGFSGIAFSSNVPHTVRGKNETKMCTDCHVSTSNDNNAWLAQLLMHGTNYLNFMGRYCWVAAGEHGFHGVIVTEQKEPQAVIGSSLHALAFPDYYKKHIEHHSELEHGHEHPGIDISSQVVKPFHRSKVLNVQLRGEYLYAACGEDGVRVFDVAMIDNKAFSERITTAPVSPVGQKFYVKTKYAAHVAAPTTVPVDPTRQQFPENREQKVHPLLGYIYVADKCEGLILIGAATTIDGNPVNNFLKREVTFNPDGLLKGATFVNIVGHYAYVCCDAGLVIVSIENPKCPKIVRVVGKSHLHKPKTVQVQFRYAYVIDEHGLYVFDVTNLEHPRAVAKMRIPDLHSIYLARTYAYVAAGKRGLLILDISNPARPRVDQWYNAKGKINDLHDVKLGITYVSEFAYLADGKNGLRVVQLTSPDTPGNYGFSPRPTPHLIATYKIPHGGEALSVSKALDRDRAADETGNQIGVFGRVGARPLNGLEQRRLYLHQGKLWKVSDDPDDRNVYPAPRPSRSRRHR